MSVEVDSGKRKTWSSCQKVELASAVDCSLAIKVRKRFTISKKMVCNGWLAVVEM